MSELAIDGEDLAAALLDESASSLLWEQWWRLRDDSSRNSLFIFYGVWLRKVVGNIMLRHKYPLAEWGDYIHLGSLGLFFAIEKYDPRQNTSFESYAYLCIKGRILKGLSSYTSESKKNASAYFASRIDDGDEESDTLSSVVNAVVGLALGYFLESGIRDEDIHESDPLFIYQNREESQFLRSLVERLPEKERFIIVSHYLHYINFKEIGELLSLSAVRVSQLHHQALKRLRKIYEQSLSD
jgi:RNA polymerase sigma factor FliA